MKLFFDARYTRTDFHDGISRYSVELGNALQELHEVTFLICDEAQKKWFADDATFLMVHKPTSLKEPLTALYFNRYHPDVVYSPMQTIGLVGKKFKAILTVHDMIYYRHKTPPRSLPLHVRLGWRLYHASYLPQRMTLQSADLITTVSETSAREIAAAKMATKPVVVIPNAPQRFATYPVEHSDTIENIIYMGSFMPYKNVETLIQAMAWLPGRTLHLLSRINDVRKAELSRLIPQGATVLFHNGVSDDEYEKLLANNAVLATASFDEGYGIPVAEAIAMGVPAVVSNIPVFHEVGASGASYADPHQPKEFAEAIRQLDNKAVREKQIQAGKDHMATFRWSTSARTLLTAITSLAR